MYVLRAWRNEWGNDLINVYLNLLPCQKLKALLFILPLLCLVHPPHQEMKMTRSQRCQWARGRGHSQTFSWRRRPFPCLRPALSSSSATPTSKKRSRFCLTFSCSIPSCSSVFCFFPLFLPVFYNPLNSHLIIFWFFKISCYFWNKRNIDCLTLSPSLPLFLSPILDSGFCAIRSSTTTSSPTSSSSSSYSAASVWQQRTRLRMTLSETRWQTIKMNIKIIKCNADTLHGLFLTATY